MKALVGAFNQEKALVGAFSVIVEPVVEPMDSFTALILSCVGSSVQVQMLGLCAVMVIFVQLQCSWNLAGTGTKLELECDGIITAQQ